MLLLKNTENIHEQSNCITSIKNLRHFFILGIPSVLIFVFNLIFFAWILILLGQLTIFGPYIMVLKSRVI